jgi:arylsulfatase A-like enzyme
MGRLEKTGKWTEFHQPGKEGKSTDCKVLVDMMLEFAGRQAKAGKRFFISSLPYEPHTPYLFHEGITDKYYRGGWGPPVGKVVDGDLLTALSSGKTKLNDEQWSRLKALYDGEVEYWDSCFARFLDGLGKLSAATDTLIVLTGDHGEGMFEHGKMGHAFGNHAELANVPFVLFGDQLVESGVTIETVSSHLDILPTILELLGVKVDPKVQGMSMVPLVTRRGPWTPRVVSLEYGRSYALRALRWKYLVDYQGREMVFDLEKDPTEQDDLLGKNDMAVRYLRDLAGFFLEYRSAWRANRMGSLNNQAHAFVEMAEKG